MVSEVFSLLVFVYVVKDIHCATFLQFCYFISNFLFLFFLNFIRMYTYIYMYIYLLLLLLLLFVCIVMFKGQIKKNLYFKLKIVF